MFLIGTDKQSVNHCNLPVMPPDNCKKIIDLSARIKLRNFSKLRFSSFVHKELVETQFERYQNAVCEGTESSSSATA